ncbi:MAG: hypothetical protein ACP5M5_01160 [Acidibrevibacterium sp.]|uniref:hypothetical protein n=1 Tax=Acidibrevibacterium sp. TaxID=2606776 RepID=UPI003D00FC5C
MAMVALAGCSSLPAAVNPANWWDSLTDRNLATERPPPPQADAPYPNLATVPDKPAPADAKAHQTIIAGLVSDRANAQYEATQVPIPDPSSPQASPALFGGSAPPPGATNTAAAAPPAAAAALAAANAPPPNVPVHPTPAPRNAVNQAPLAAPPTSAATTPAAATQVAAADTPPPSMPETPPPPPQVPGAAIPPTKPAPPPTKPPAPPAGKPPLSAAEAKPLTIGFPIGSAVVPPAEIESIKALAARRGNRSIVVVGYGDASNATPQTQTAAVTLALARARAVIATLTAAGVPMDAISMDAEANGHGALARLVE